MGGGDEVGMDWVIMSYILGEVSDLWVEVFELFKCVGGKVF